MKNKSQTIFLSILVLFTGAYTYATPIDTAGLPKNIASYIQQREVCNQARETLINQLRAKKQALDQARLNTQKYCMGSDAGYQKLLKQYKNNQAIIDKLTLVNGMGDLVFLEAPIQFGQTIDALMPPDIVAALPRISNCLHFAGEFAGDGSKEDKAVNQAMKKLKCNQIDQTLNQLQKAYGNNADALMFIKTLRELF